VRNLTVLKKSTVGNHTYTSTFDSVAGLIHHTSSHLTCFHGGNWILGLFLLRVGLCIDSANVGGKLLNNDTIVQYGLELVDACMNTYLSTVYGFFFFFEFRSSVRELIEPTELV
jgi:mannosyl-oligosaccharide alpha-1,2-mannosidase